MMRGADRLMGNKKLRRLDALMALPVALLIWRLLPIENALLRGAAAVAGVLACWCLLYMNYQLYVYRQKQQGREVNDSLL